MVIKGSVGKGELIMIQQESNLEVADNTGAKAVRCIRVDRKSTRLNSSH